MLGELLGATKARIQKGYSVHSTQTVPGLAMEQLPVAIGSQFPEAVVQGADLLTRQNTLFPKPQAKTTPRT